MSGKAIVAFRSAERCVFRRYDHGVIGDDGDKVYLDSATLESKHRVGPTH